MNHSLRKCLFSILILPIQHCANQLYIATYGFAKQYSGVNLGSFQKHITSSNLTAEGLRNVGSAVMQLAKVEELEAHRRAVEIRINHMDAQK